MSSKYQPPTHEEIAICAHSIYIKEGRPSGRSTQHWLQAEAQLIAERKAQAAEAEKAPAQAKPGNTWPAPQRGQQAVQHRN